MSQLSIHKRYISLLQLFAPPASYPSLEKVIDSLSFHGIDYSERSFRRDRKHLNDEYGYSIRFDKIKKGYYARIADDEDISDFSTFRQLLERKLRFDFLAQPQMAHHWRKALLLEEDHNFIGLRYFEAVWNAIQARRVISFDHRSFDKNKEKVRRRLAPGLIAEDRNRWYVVGMDMDKNKLRMFGLDRMDRPQMTDETFEGDPAAAYRDLWPHVLGVSYKPEDHPEEVVLRFNTFQASYIKTKPIHHSQQIMEETDEYLVIKLRLIINFEFQREILSHGERVEVLAPAHLRTTVATRVRQQAVLYSPDFK